MNEANHFNGSGKEDVGDRHKAQMFSSFIGCLNKILLIVIGFENE